MFTAEKCRFWTAQSTSSAFLFIHFIFIYLGMLAPSVDENCFSGGRDEEFSDYNNLILFLKMARDGACLT